MARRQRRAVRPAGAGSREAWWGRATLSSNPVLSEEDEYPCRRRGRPRLIAPAQRATATWCGLGGLV
jgi:hypothetical protein